jgi:hypothetical protein
MIVDIHKVEADDPGVEAAAFDSRYRNHREEIKR